VTLVTRGMDLFAASHVHRLLQALLGLPVPTWHHHPLLLDADGRKLAKRRGSAPGSAGRPAAGGEDGRRWPTRCASGACRLALPVRRPTWSGHEHVLVIALIVAWSSS
jgi:glutamyl-Q tRNA(Asp) synthetase